MHFSEEYGVLISAGRPWTDEELSVALSGDSGANLLAIRELLDKGVAKRDPRGAIYSGRMRRDQEKRVAGKHRQQQHREKVSHTSHTSVTPIKGNGNVTGLSNIPKTTIPLKEFSLDDFDGEIAFMRHYAIWQKHESYAECGHPAKYAYVEAIEKEGADKKVGRKQAAEYLDGRADLYLTTMPRKFQCGMTRWLKEGIYSQNEAAWRERGGGTGSKKASLDSYAE